MTVTRTAVGTVLIASALFVAKVLAAIASGSIGVVSTAVDSGVDLAISLTVLLGVVLARRPADPEHPYGHGKFENVAGLVEAGVLAGTGVVVGFVAVRRIIEPEMVTLSAWVVGVMLMALALDAERAWRLRRAAREHRSPALAVDAWHFASDLVTTVVVLVGVALASRGTLWADGASALLVALVLTAGSVRVGWIATAGLVDRISPDLTHRVAEAIGRVEHVEGSPQVRVRGAGPDLFVDATVKISRALGMEQAHEVMDRVEDAVRGAVGRADVVVHAEPAAGRENIATTLKVLAGRDPDILGVHEIYVDRLGDALVADCHVEVDARLTLEDGHRVVQRFEALAKATLPELSGLRTHIEPMRTDPRTGRDVTRENDGLVGRIEGALATPPFVGAGRIAIKEVGGRLEAVVAGRLPVGTALLDAHEAAEELERILLSRLPQLARVVVHVEPAD